MGKFATKARGRYLNGFHRYEILASTQYRYRCAWAMKTAFYAVYTKRPLKTIRMYVTGMR